MSDTVIAASSIVAEAEPYVVALIGVVVSAVGVFISTQIQKYTGVVVNQAILAKVETYISEKAAQAVAGASDNLAHAQINVHSPIVADIVSKIVAAIPEELNAVGLDPVSVAHKLAAAFGRLQASMTTTTIPPAKADAGATK